MMKNFVKTVAVVLTTALTLTGCAEKKENGIIDEPAASTAENTASEDKVESTASAAIEEKPVSSTTTETTVSKVESKVEETTSTMIEEKPVSSTTTGKTEETSSKSSSTTTSSTTTSTSSSRKSSTSSKPTSSSKPSSTTTSSSKPTEKPVEEPVKTHDCSVDGHVWETTYTTTEPKWCYEMHDVTDFGFDNTLAERKYPELAAPYETFLNNMEAIGVMAGSGSGTREVQVWGTETYERKECKECGHIVQDFGATITPMGEWQFKDGKNKVIERFDTLFYDPYNVPQKVINNINDYWAEIFGW